MEITANVVTMDEGTPVMIGFADDDKKPANYLLLQYDPTEKEAGLYIEANDQQRSGYGLVQSIQLSEGNVRIELTPDGAQTLKTNSTIAIIISSQAAGVWALLKPKISELLGRIVVVDL